MMEKEHQPESLAVTMKPDYPPSEIYSSTSEPPPAYVRPKSAAVQVAKIIAVTVVLMSVILGAFVLASAYVSANSSCRQLEQELALLNEAADRFQNQGPIQPEALISEESRSEPETEKKHSKVNEINNNEIPDFENNKIDNARVQHVKLPIQIDMDGLAENLIKQNTNQKMNCFVDKKHTEEIVDHKPKNINLPFGLNITTDPRLERISGERMVIICESRNSESDRREPESKPQEKEDENDVEATIMIQPMMIPIPHSNFPTHMNMMNQQMGRPAAPQMPMRSISFSAPLHMRPEFQMRQEMPVRSEMTNREEMQIRPHIEIIRSFQMRPQIEIEQQADAQEMQSPQVEIHSSAEAMSPQIKNGMAPMMEISNQQGQQPQMRDFPPVQILNQIARQIIFQKAMEAQKRNEMEQQRQQEMQQRQQEMQQRQQQEMEMAKSKDLQREQETQESPEDDENEEDYEVNMPIDTTKLIPEEVLRTLNRLPMPNQNGYIVVQEEEAQPTQQPQQQAQQQLDQQQNQEVTVQQQRGSAHEMNGKQNLSPIEVAVEPQPTPEVEVVTTKEPRPHLLSTNEEDTEIDGVEMTTNEPTKDAPKIDA